VIPSLFILPRFFLSASPQVHFAVSMLAAAALTTGFYFLFFFLLKKSGIIKQKPRVAVRFWLNLLRDS